MFCYANDNICKRKYCDNIPGQTKVKIESSLDSKKTELVLFN